MHNVLCFTGKSHYSKNEKHLVKAICDRKAKQLPSITQGLSRYLQFCTIPLIIQAVDVTTLVTSHVQPSILSGYLLVFTWGAIFKIHSTINIICHNPLF